MTHRHGQEVITVAQIRRKQLEQITPGDSIMYTLRTEQHPRQPDKEWRGKVLEFYPTIQMVRVASLEAGYEDCEENVWSKQINRIEKPINTSY